MMLTRIAMLILIIGIPIAANADALASGTITQVNISSGAIGVMITAAPGSACGTGWYYAFDSDSSTNDVNRLLSAIYDAQARGASVSLYANSPVTCSTSHFLAITSQ